MKQEDFEKAKPLIEKLKTLNSQQEEILKFNVEGIALVDGNGRQYCIYDDELITNMFPSLIFRVYDDLKGIYRDAINKLESELSSIGKEPSFRAKGIEHILSQQKHPINQDKDLARASLDGSFGEKTVYGKIREGIKVSSDNLLPNNPSEFLETEEHLVEDAMRFVLKGASKERIKEYKEQFYAERLAAWIEQDLEFKYGI